MANQSSILSIEDEIRQDSFLNPMKTLPALKSTEAEHRIAHPATTGHNGPHSASRFFLPVIHHNPKQPSQTISAPAGGSISGSNISPVKGARTNTSPTRSAKSPSSQDRSPIRKPESRKPCSTMMKPSSASKPSPAPSSGSGSGASCLSPPRSAIRPTATPRTSPIRVPEIRTPSPSSSSSSGRSASSARSGRKLSQSPNKKRSPIRTPCHRYRNALDDLDERVRTGKDMLPGYDVEAYFQLRRAEGEKGPWSRSKLALNWESVDWECL